MQLIEKILESDLQISPDALHLMSDIEDVDNFLQHIKTKYPDLIVIEKQHLTDYIKSLSKNDKSIKMEPKQTTRGKPNTTTKKEKLIDNISKTQVSQDIWKITETKSYLLKKNPITSIGDLSSHYQSRYDQLSKIAINTLGNKNIKINDISTDQIPLKGKLTVKGLLYNKKFKNEQGNLTLESDNGIKIDVSLSTQEQIHFARKLPKDILLVVSGDVDFKKDTEEEISLKDGHIIWPNLKRNEIDDDESITSIIDYKNDNIDNYILLVGNIHFGNSKFSEDKFNKFVNYLEEGETPYTTDTHHYIHQRLKGVFFLGDILDKFSFSRYDEYFDYAEKYRSFFSKFSQVSDKIPLVAIPGETDIADYFLPQNPLNNDLSDRFLFFSNPCRLRYGMRDILLFHDFTWKYLPWFIELDNIAEFYRWKLQFRHLLSKWGPEKNKFHPLTPDPFIIDNLPDLFVIGHHQVVSNTVFKQSTRIVTTGTFLRSENQLIKKSLGVIPAINLSNLEISYITF